MSDRKQLLLGLDALLKETAELYYRSQEEGDTLNGDVLTLIRSFVIGRCTRRVLAAGALRCASTDPRTNDGLEETIENFMTSGPAGK